MDRDPMTDPEFDYIPKILTEKPGRQWWIISVCLLVGALIGLGASNLFPPVYEAVFKVTTDVKLTENPEITEFMVDNALLHVGELVYQQPLLEKVVEAEQNLGIELTPAVLKEISSVERQINTTFLKIQWSDPQTAEQIANTWGMLFYASLEEGARQATIAGELAQTQKLLEDCLAGIQSTTPGAPACSLSKDTLESEITATTNEIVKAQNLSLGLYKELQVNAYEKATLPTSPIRRERGWMITSGAGVGLLFGLLLSEIILKPKQKSGLK